MKQWIKRILTGLVVLAVTAGCCMLYFDQTYTVLHMPSVICQYMLDGVTPEEFCKSQGAGTILYGCFPYSKVDKDGCLILVLDKNMVKPWKDSLLQMQIMQCVFGDSRDIGVTIDYSRDILSFMKNADSCGFEISEDYTKIVDENGDNTFYFPFIMSACLMMQVFSGRTCENITVEYLRYGPNGEILDRILYPEHVIGGYNPDN